MLGRWEVVPGMASDEEKGKEQETYNKEEMSLKNTSQNLSLAQFF